MTTTIDGTAVSTFGAGITCTSTNEAVHTEAAHATTSDIWAPSRGLYFFYILMKRKAVIALKFFIHGWDYKNSKLLFT